MSSPDNLAVESEYYRLKPLNEQEKEVVRMLCVKNRTQSHGQIAESMLEFLNYPYDLIGKIRNWSPEAAAVLPMNVVEVNYVEDLYELIENQMCPILDKMRARDLSSGSCPSEAPWLALFLATQYFRTKSMEHRLLTVLTPEVRKATSDCDWDRIWRVMRVVLAFQVAASLYALFDLAECKILESPSSVDLLTSDQPLFNTKAEFRDEDGSVEDFVLYFPVTPRFAALFHFGSPNPGQKLEFMPEGNARHLNQRIAEQAYRQVFARRRDELDALA